MEDFKSIEDSVVKAIKTANLWFIVKDDIECRVAQDSFKGDMIVIYIMTTYLNNNQKPVAFRSSQGMPIADLREDRNEIIAEMCSRHLSGAIYNLTHEVLTQ